MSICKEVPPQLSTFEYLLLSLGHKSFLRQMTGTYIHIQPCLLTCSFLKKDTQHVKKLIKVIYLLIQIVLGKVVQKDAKLDQALVQDLLRLGKDFPFHTVSGKTVCTNDFYEGDVCKNFMIEIPFFVYPHYIYIYIIY